MYSIKKAKSIVLPRVLGLPPYAVDYDTNQRGIITIQKAKDIVFAAVLNDDAITISQDDTKGIVIDIISKAEFERAKGEYEVVFKAKDNV